MGLLGPNGAGKTTTFYMTVGLIVPNEGNIFLDNQNITKFPVYKRAQHGIGYLAQEASIFRKMTVEATMMIRRTTEDIMRESLSAILTTALASLKLCIKA